MLLLACEQLNIAQEETYMFEVQDETLPEWAIICLSVFNFHLKLINQHLQYCGIELDQLRHY